LLDLVVDDIRVPVNAVGVDGLQDADAVPRAGGDLSGTSTILRGVTTGSSMAALLAPRRLPALL
jgi:hypothetical protein